MLFNKRVFVIGGDMRIGKMAECLKCQGFTVKGFAMPDAGETIEQVGSLDEGLSTADIIVLGLPASTDGETVSAPFYNKKIFLGDLIPKINKNQVFLGGRLDGFITSLLDDYEIKWEDYFKREELAILNAVPTALVI